MMDLAELTWGRYNGGSVAPIGSYWCPRNNAIQQLTADGTLAQDGTWCRVDASGTQTFANIATTINGVLSTSFTAGSFHAQGTGDIIPNPGQAADDA
jgi:hypothetical protein